MPRFMQSTSRALTGADGFGGGALSLRGLPLAVPDVRITRRTLQVVLGLIWLLDGALQLQPFMLRASFAREVLAPTGDGQPQFVAGPVHWAANIVAAHPVAWDVPFATIQLLLGVGLLVPRTVKLTIVASVLWSLLVWYLAEGFSGLASGHASLLTGAPGAVLLYALLAIAAWPHGDASREAPAPWLPLAWAVLWVGGAIFQALPGQNTGTAVAGTILGGPGWLGRLDASVGRWSTQHGTTIVVALVVVEVVIGLGALYRRSRDVAVAAGVVLALLIWVIAQDIGQLYTGQATDPNSGLLIVLFGLAVLGVRRTPGGLRANR
jgi:hypothetical protein